MSEIQSTEAKNVCHACIGDQFLADEVNREGTLVICSYCGETRDALALEILADRIHEVLQEHFELTPNEPDAFDSAMMREGSWDWYREGNPVADTIADIAELSEEIAGDVRGLLHASYQHEAIMVGEENPYGVEACYDESETNDWKFPDTWAAFRTEIRSRARFFNGSAERMLHDIFGDLNSLRVFPDKPVILEVGPEDEGRFIWRARQAMSEQDLRAILMSPSRQIGPPPSKLAKGGRMNTHGIPVFYGAMEQSTCVSEVRPPVGSYVVLARFEVLRRMRLLDLNTLKEIYVGGSHFDPDYTVRKGRKAFLRYLVKELSQPVMPQDEAMEYLITQAVAEYLADKAEPPLDGIIFPSSQTGGDGRNVVLFNRACGVETQILPVGTETSVHIPSHFGEDEYEDIFAEGVYVTVTVPSNPTDEEPETGTNPGLRHSVPSFEDDEQEEEEHNCNPTLRLDKTSLEVLRINAVTYDRDSHRVSRIEQTTEERDAVARKFSDVDFNSILNLGTEGEPNNQP